MTNMQNKYRFLDDGEQDAVFVLAMTRQQLADRPIQGLKLRLNETSFRILFE